MSGRDNTIQKLSDQQFYMTSEKGITKDADTSNLFIFPNNSHKSYFKDINNLNSHLMDSDLETPVINCNDVDVNSYNYKNKKNSFSFSSEHSITPKKYR